MSRRTGPAMRLGAALTFAAALLTAQRTGPYSVGPVWWNAGAGGVLPWEEEYENPDGWVSILNKNGAVHTEGHPFFESLGTNRRACVTCHQPSNGMSVTPETLRERWNETKGRDPVFAAVDGSNCPDLPQNIEKSHSLLLERGLFRIALPWPPQAKPEFRIDVVRDPTGCNFNSSERMISVFRRPRIPANLDDVARGRFALMTDGREPSLREQAVNAILTHEQAERTASEEQLRKIVEFESQVYAAQSADIRAGRLNEKGGPLLGTSQLVPTLVSFDIWRKTDTESDLGLQREFRASVARGASVFFERTFQIPGGDTMYTCASCHTPGAPQWMDIATTNVHPEQASPDLPLFRITCNTGAVIYSQDPGRALISGKCADIGAIVPQQLKALAARAPYFSNGSARTLRDVVDFYERQFKIRYSERQKQDLTNFLRVL